MYPEKLVNMAACHSFSSTNLWKKQHVQANFSLRTLLPSDQWLILLRHECGMETKGVRKHQPVTFPNSQIFWCITHMYLWNFALLINLPPFSIGDIPHILQLGYLIYTGCCQVAKQDAVKDLTDGTGGTDGCGLTSWIFSPPLRFHPRTMGFKPPLMRFHPLKMGEWIINSHVMVTTRWYHGTALWINPWNLRDAKNHGHYLMLNIIPKSGCTTLKPFINLGT